MRNDDAIETRASTVIAVNAPPKPSDDTPWASPRTKNVPARPAPMLLPSASLTWSEAVLRPISTGADSCITASDELASDSPMPSPASSQPPAAATSSRPGSQADAATRARPAVVLTAPARMIRSRRSRSQGRDCSQAPTVQPTDPMISTSPAQSSGSPSACTSISGRNAWPPENPPAVSARTPITESSPRPPGRKPAGSNGGSPHHSSPTPSASQASDHTSMR
jgi:hypothetical protein